MGQSVIRNPRKIHSQSGGDPSLPTRVTNLENNEYKVTYYEVISGTSGSLTIPSQATINAGEFGLSGNCILSKIDGSNKPTFESPKTAGGVVVTASLNETTGAWVASAVYTDVSVALIYSIKIKAINYSNLTYANIIETVDVGLAHLDSPTFTGTVTTPAINVSGLTPSQIVETDASKNLVSAAKGTAYNKNFGTTAGTVLEGDRITQTITNGVTDKAPSEDAVFDALALKLTAANNLSDLANPLTARNNLKEWDLRITTGNQSTTSNVATNITDLVSHTLTANKLYDFEGHIYVNCNNTGGVKFQITIPTGATIVACFDGSIGSNATFQSSIVLASATLTGFNFIQFNGSNIIKVKGQVLLGGTAGTIQFGFASGTNTQTSTINQLGTHITLRQLD